MQPFGLGVSNVYLYLYKLRKLQTRIKIKNTSTNKIINRDIVSDTVPDYSKEAFFIKKAQDALKRVEKAGFPPSFIEKK